MGRWFQQSKLLTVNGDICIDRFVRLEHMAADLKEILNEIGGTDLDLSRLPHTKKSTSHSRELSDYYDADTEAIVRERMKWIFDRFNYSIEIDGK